MTKQKTIKLDGAYSNAFLHGMGTNSRRILSGYHLLPKNILQSVYMHNGFARLICDKPAEEMTRAGFTLENISDERQEAVQARFEELDAAKHLNDALKWRRAFGGALIVIGADDGLLLEDEMNPDAVSNVDFLRTYDRHEISIERRYQDPKNPKFGRVELYKVNPSDGVPTYIVHETRCLVFDGEAVPNDVRNYNDGWGASVLQNCMSQITRLEESHTLALKLMERMQQAVHKIPDLSQQNEDDVVKRIGIVDMVRGLHNTIVVDALEEYTVTSLSLSGVKDIVDKAGEALGAVSSVPSYILLGQTEGGLGSSSDASKEGWNAQIAAWQNDQLRKPLDKLITLLLRGDSEGESDGGEYKLVFNPLSGLSDKDQAAIDLQDAQAEKTEMETLTGYVNAGVMDQDEVREAIREEYDLQGEAPEPEAEPPEHTVLNPGQKIVETTPGQNNPAPVGKK